jgi:alanine racemase
VIRAERRPTCAFDFNLANFSSVHTTPRKFATPCSRLLSNGTTSQIAFALSTVGNSPRRRVVFSADALRSNLHELIGAEGSKLVVDLRCDAYGFGASWVREQSENAGVSHFLIDDNTLSPPPPTTAALFGLTSGSPVAVVHGEVVALKHIVPGDAVSYGYTWTATRDTRLALVALGFADGVPRSGSNSGRVRINDVSVPVVGRIAMDQLVVDVTDAHVDIGDDAMLWSKRDDINSWTNADGPDPLSLIARLTWRVEREWVAV